MAPRRRKRRGGNNILLAIFSVVFKAIRLLLAYLFDYGSVAKCAQEYSIPLEHIKKIHFRKSHFFGKKGKFTITTNSCSIVPATFKNGKAVSDTLVQAVLATVKPERSS